MNYSFHSWSHEVVNGSDGLTFLSAFTVEDNDQINTQAPQYKYNDNKIELNYYIQPLYFQMTFMNLPTITKIEISNWKKNWLKERDDVDKNI